MHSKPDNAFGKDALVKLNISNAGVAKLVDAPDLGSGAARRGGSSPSTRTKFDKVTFFFLTIEHLSALLGCTVLGNLAYHAWCVTN